MSELVLGRELGESAEAGRIRIESQPGPTRLLPGGGKIVRMKDGTQKYVSARGLHDALRCGGVIVDDNPPQFQRGPSVTEQKNEAAADLKARESAR